MRPLLLLDAQLVVRAKVSRGEGFDYLVSLEGDICNFGGGPATAISLVVIPDAQKPAEFTLGIVGPNARQELKSIQWTTWSFASGY